MRHLGFLFAFAFLTCGCFLQPHHTFVSDLEGKGIVPVSEDNAYLTSSLLLAEERKHSKLLDGFLKEEGLPTALKVETASGKQLVVLYYPDSKEEFQLERGPRDWVVTGPMPLSAAAAKQLGHENGPAKSTKNQKAKISPARKKRPPAAEAVKKEDVIHEVTSEKENLVAIVTWHTGSAANVGAIARINEIENPSKLAVGQEIKIPSYLVTNSKPFPVSFLPAAKR